jgi:hypothetical protein
MRHKLAAVGLLVLTAAAAQPASSQTPSFAGTWKLNKEASDDPREKLQEATERGMKMTDGMSGGRGTVRTGAGRVDGESGGGREPGAGGGGGGGALSGPDFMRVMRPAPQIVVEQNDTAVIVRDDRGLPQVFYLDGRKVEEPMPGAEPKQTTAKLGKDGKLTIERKLGGLGAMKEVYVLDAEKRRLVVEAKLTSPTLGKTVEIKRVYDAGS